MHHARHKWAALRTLGTHATEARAAKDFAEADAIRDQLQAMGIEVEDTAAGPVWRRI